MDTLHKELVDAIIGREIGSDPHHNGGYTNDPDDNGGRTQYGISEHAHPEAWADGKVTFEEAEHIDEESYVKPLAGIEDTWLLHQMSDFAEHAGMDAAVRVLQQVLGVGVDGKIGPRTLRAIASYNSGPLFGVQVPGFVLMNLAYRDARTLFYAGITKRFPKNLKYLLGWLKRALEFR